MENVLITGASRGIGLELANQFASKNYQVFATYRGKPTKDLAQLGSNGNVTLLALEVTDEVEVKKLANHLSDTAFDIIINNAGILGPQKQNYNEIEVEAWQQIFLVNTIAPLLVSRAFIPHLKQSQNPRLITISSDLGALSHQENFFFAYSSSKAAVNKVMQQLSRELNDITVCPVHPGWVQTDMGGSEASLTPIESASGIMTLIEGLSPKHSGQFFNWDGTSRDW